MLIALHGFTETDQVWSTLLAGTVPVLKCPLLPGHGSSPCPPGTTQASEAQRIAAMLPASGGSLVGYSMGARLALRTALDHPQRVQRLILISATTGIANVAERERRRAKDEGLAQILDEDGIGPFVAWWESNPALKPMRPYPETVAETVRSMRLNQEPKGLAAALRAFGQGASEDLLPRLDTLRIPLLLIVGEADAPYRANAERMAAKVPGARVEAVAESAHTVHREQPTVVRHLIRSFLR